jgi:hypothetical protein
MSRGGAGAALLLLLLPAPARPLTPDIVEPGRLPPTQCQHGCARWADVAADASPLPQTAVDALWRDPAHHHNVSNAQREAGDACAQPGLSPFQGAGWGVAALHMVGGWAGSYCFCKDPLSTLSSNQGNALFAPTAGNCQPSTAQQIPEQINLLLTGPSAVAASWVTFGANATAAEAPPLVELRLLSRAGGGGGAVNVTGATHVYAAPGTPILHLAPVADPLAYLHPVPEPYPTRFYRMHFVLLSGLVSRASYTYRVRAGGAEDAAAWSPSFTFRAPYGDGEAGVSRGDTPNRDTQTRFAIFGDCPGRRGRLSALSVFLYKSVSMVLLYGRAGHLNTKNAGFRPGQWGYSPTATLRCPTCGPTPTRA